MMIQINAVTTSVLINVTTKVIATATPVESPSSGSLLTADEVLYMHIRIMLYVVILLFYQAGIFRK